jgi:Thioesterase-like superfamily
MSSAFFEPTDDPNRFTATSHCSSAWSTTLQHGGPPSALLVRTVEGCPSSIDGPAQIARFTVDILGPLPIEEVVVAAHVVRAGRRIELVEASLEVGGRTAMVARAWRMRVADLDLPVPGGVVAVQHDMPGFPRGPVAIPPIPEPATTAYALDIWNRGYADAVDWRFVVGSPEGGQPATVWARPRIDLVAGETMTPASRLLLLADTGNGLSRILDIDTWWFINTELTVHIHRQPSSDWILLTARSTVEPNGTGITETELYDTQGRVARAAQALLVSPR